VKWCGEKQGLNIIADFAGDPGPLGDGYRVEARLVVWKADQILRVPASALFRKGEGWGVFVVENGQSCERPVEIGHRTPFNVEVLRGIETGAEVILHPNNQIKDGLRVKVQ
jgi:HlyD family secretion protein